MKLPPYDWWRTVFYLIPVLAGATIVCGTASLLSTLVDPSGDAAHRWARRWGRVILRVTGVRLRVSGVALPDRGAGCVFVANHSSFFDIPVLFAALPFQVRLMAKAALGRVPFIGWHLRRAGHLLVDRARPGAAILKRMQRMVRHGASLVVFPEASRTSDGRVGRFKGGIFLLAIENGLPIVPVTIVGTRRVLPKGRLMATPADVEVILHDPVATTSLNRDDARALAERVQATVAASTSPDVKTASG